MANTLKHILDLLNESDWLIGDEDIDIAKGKYKASGYGDLPKKK